MKTVSTRYALKEAIINAVATVNRPMFIPAIATVTAD